MRKAMLAPEPRRPAVKGKSRSSGRCSSRSNTRRSKPLPKPAWASIQAWAGVSTSAGKIIPVTQATRWSAKASVRRRSQRASTSTSSSVKATTSPVTWGRAALWARARPGRSSRT